MTHTRRYYLVRSIARAVATTIVIAATVTLLWLLITVSVLR